MLEHKQSKDNKENLLAVRKHSLEHQTVNVENKTQKRDHIEEKMKNTEIYDETNVSMKDYEPDSTVSGDVNDIESNVSCSTGLDCKASHSKSVPEKSNLVEAEVNIEPEDTLYSTSPHPSNMEKPVKENKRRQSLNTQNIDTDTITTGQPSTDKFLENFGFFSERKPRKSNLLASKKIAETIHMINDSDDAYFSTKDRANKRLTHHRESKKISEAETTLKTLQGTYFLSRLFVHIFVIY